MRTLSSGPCKSALVYVYTATICINVTGQSCPTLMGEMTMVRKIGVAAAVALVTFLVAPGPSFEASKAKSSHSDLTKCKGGACTPRNPDRDPNTSVSSQHQFRRPHKTLKTQPKN